MTTSAFVGRSYKGKSPKLGEGAFVDPSAVLVGDIEIGADSSIWPLVAARGDVNHIRIGARTNVQDGAILHVTRTSPEDATGYPLIIGDDVTVGHQVMLHGCTVGNRILIGMSATVMDGAVVEDDVIIGAGSLVPPGKCLTSGYLYVGSPVKQARRLTDEEQAFLKKSAENYVWLKNDYLAEAE
ncbi:MAG: gamma carbonic anhydrase family protein [Idiomarina sp.]|nr:gamma carbonic anhydrase family protein [Idiomarina sp.]